MAETYVETTKQSIVIDGVPQSAVVVLAQDAGRTTDVVTGAILGYIATSGKVVAFDPTATDGSAVNLAVHTGPTIAFADIVAGDIAGVPVVVGGNVKVREDLLVLDADTIDTAYATGTKTVRQSLYNRGIYPQSTDFNTTA